MQGHASVFHLRQLLHSDTSTRYQHLLDSHTLGWLERENVYISFGPRRGKLTVGYGVAGKKKRPLKKFGPELGFGTVVGNFFENEFVVIIKYARGGRSLAVDFRPPSARLDNVTYAPCLNTSLCDPYKPSEYGKDYRDMILEFQNTLSDIPKILSSANVFPNAGKEFSLDYQVDVSGLVWFQGWNDVTDPDKICEYPYNLQHLLTSIRHDLHAPHLPVVIGELGVFGRHPPPAPRPAILGLRKRQKLVTQLKEFCQTTVLVETSPYADYILKDNASFGVVYHYHGRADTMYRIGEAFGNSMLDLLFSNRTGCRHHLNNASVLSLSHGRSVPSETTLMMEHAYMQLGTELVLLCVMLVWCICHLHRVGNSR